MKFNLFKNDKTTIKDELYLFLFILACIAVGTILVIYAPRFWIITSTGSKAFGVLWIVVGVMFVPGLIYRLLTNEIEKK